MDIGVTMLVVSYEPFGKRLSTSAATAVVYFTLVSSSKAIDLRMNQFQCKTNLGQCMYNKLITLEIDQMPIFEYQYYLCIVIGKCPSCAALMSSTELQLGVIGITV